MIATPKHYFSKEAQSHHLRAARSSANPRPLPMTMPGVLKLTRDNDKFVVTTATPGIHADNLQVELLANRTIHVRILQPWSKPRARKSGALLGVSPSKAYFEDDSANTGVVEDKDKEAPVLTQTDTSADHATPDVVPDIQADASVDKATPQAAPDNRDDNVNSVSPAEVAEDGVEEKEEVEMVVVFDKSLTLPRPVDDAGISCTYDEGLLRIEIPFTAPAPDAENEKLKAKLQQDVSEAAAQLAVYEQQVRDQRDKVRAAHAALRAAKAPTHSSPAAAIALSILPAARPANRDEESNCDQTASEAEAAGAQEK